MIRALQVDAAGRIYVLDDQPQDIRVFSEDARFIRHVGRAGPGPGEHLNVNGLAWDSLGRLLVVDQQHARNTFFDTSGRFIASEQRPVSGFWTWTWGGAVLADGRTLEELSVRGPDDERLQAFGVVASDGMTRDTLVPPEPLPPPFGLRLQRGDRTWRLAVPFGAVGVLAIDPRGYLWRSRSDRYRIVQLGLRGDTMRVLERSVDASPVSMREADSALNVLTQRVGAGPDLNRAVIPGVKPYFNSLTVADDGRLWVLRSRGENQSGTTVDVFDPEGRYEGTAATPLLLERPIMIRRDKMYAVARDSNDVTFVVRLRVDYARTAQ